ncbi:MAG: hypothetical protein AAGA77_07200 [Bacteroidota bacterium]
MNYKLSIHKISESYYFKFFCLFLALTIFNLSCSSVPDSNETDCIPMVFNFNDNDDIDHYFENAMELSSSLIQQNNYQSLEEFIRDVYPDNDQTDQFIADYQSELLKYGEMGFEPYLTDAATNGLISANLKTELINLTDDLKIFLETSQPNLDQILQYFNDYKVVISTLDLCDEDKRRLVFLMEIYAGYADYMYKYVPINLKSGKESQLRDCNWLEAIFCGILSVTIGAAITTVVGVPLLAVTIITHDKDGGTGGTIRDVALVLYSIYFAGTLGYRASTSFYDWCCGIEEQTCEEPTGVYIQPQECNVFKYGLYGPSEYATTIWNNNNTDPAMDTTSTPQIELRVPNPNNPSEMIATILCVAEADEFEVFTNENVVTFDYDESYSLPTPVWGYAPPTNASVNISYDISVTLGSDNTTSLSWSVSPFGGSVSPTGNYSAKLTFFTTGMKTVTATFTDLCNGDSVSISKDVNVN